MTEVPLSQGSAATSETRSEQEQEKLKWSILGHYQNCSTWYFCTHYLAGQVCTSKVKNSTICNCDTTLNLRVEIFRCDHIAHFIRAYQLCTSFVFFGNPDQKTVSSWQCQKCFFSLKTFCVGYESELFTPFLFSLHEKPNGWMRTSWLSQLHNVLGAQL